MRCEVWSGALMLRVMAVVIALFLAGFFLPSLWHGLRVCMCAYVWALFFILLLCNAAADLGKSMHQGDRERAE